MLFQAPQEDALTQSSQTWVILGSHLGTGGITIANPDRNKRIHLSGSLVTQSLLTVIEYGGDLDLAQILEKVILKRVRASLAILATHTTSWLKKGFFLRSGPSGGHRVNLPLIETRSSNIDPPLCAQGEYRTHLTLCAFFSVFERHRGLDTRDYLTSNLTLVLFCRQGEGGGVPKIHKKKYTKAGRSVQKGKIHVHIPSPC